MTRCGKGGDELLGEHLHVSGEDREVGLVLADEGDLLLADEGDLALLRCALVFFRDRNDHERDAIEVGDGLIVGVVGNDERDFAVQFADLVAVEQVDQAVIIFRNHDDHALALAGSGKAPFHAELVGDRIELLGEFLKRQIKTIWIELHAHEEPSRLGVGVLVGVEDVAAVPEDEVGDSSDQSFLVWAANEEDGAGSHGSNALCGNWEICVVPKGTLLQAHCT